MKKTPWFPPDVKPVRKGVYERGFSFDTSTHLFSVPFCYWDGAQWHGIGKTPDDALLSLGYIASCFNGALWRGLAEEPK